MGRDDLKRSYVRGHMRSLAFISGTVGAIEAIKQDPDKARLASAMASSGLGVEEEPSPSGNVWTVRARPSFSVLCQHNSEASSNNRLTFITVHMSS